MSRETERDLEIALEECHGELAAMIKASNEKVGELNRDLYTLTHEVFGLSHPDELEYRNTIDGLKQELSKWEAWGKKLEAENMNLMKKNIDLRKDIDTLIEESQKEG